MEVFELRVINPGTGVADIVLPDVETFTISPTLSDVGTVQFTYPKNGVNQSQLVNDTEIAVYYLGAEVPSLRSTLEQRTGDDASMAESGDLRTHTCRTNLSRLDRAVVYPSGWPTNNNPPSQSYSAQTPGFVVLDLMNKIQARGGLGYIDTSTFSATHDSAGNAWTSTIAISFDAQTDYLTVLTTMVSYSIIDVKVDIHSLKIYNYQSTGTDRTVIEPPVVLRRGRDLSQAQFQASTRGLSTVALVAGDNNTYVETSVSGPLAALGRREVGYSQNGVTDTGTLTSTGQAFLATVSAEVKSRTIQLNFGDPKTPVPLSNFHIGDWVFTDLGDGVLTRQRVIIWSVSKASDGTLTGDVTLDNFFQEKLNRINGRLNALQNGVVIVGGSVPNPVVAIKYPPAQVTGVLVASATYQDGQGHTFAQATVGWTPVTLDTNGGAETNLANYAVRWRLHATTSWGPTTLAEASATAAYLSPFLPNIQYDFEVAAVDTQNNYGAWSTLVTQTMSVDTTPPNAPSTPVLASRLGQLVIVWDGRDNTAGSMPVDFDHTEVHVSTGGSGFTPSSVTLSGAMRTAGSLQVGSSSLVYGTTYYCKLVAVDRSGNASTPSTAGSAVLTQVVTTDVGTGQVGLSNIAFSDVGNLIDNGSFEDALWRATRNTAFGGSHFGFDNTTASSGTWSVIHTGFAVGNESVILSTISAKVGQTFMGAADIKMTSAVTGSMFVSLTINWLDGTGATISSSDLLTNWSAPSTNDNTWRTRITGTPGTAPANTVQAQVILKSTSHTAGSVWIDNVEVRMQLDTLLVKDAAITNAKINDLAANKITAGTLNAAIVLGGVIETASSGQRVAMDSTGFHAYDSGGAKIFDVSSSSAVLTLGKNTTSGAQITIDTSTPFPTISLSSASLANQATISAFAVGSNDAALVISSGKWVLSGTTYHHEIAMQADNGLFIDTWNDTGNYFDGGKIILSNSFATYGLFPHGATHGGQLTFGYDSGHADCTYEIDGFQNNGAAPAPAQAIYGASVSAAGGTTTISLGYGVTMFSSCCPVVSYSCGTNTVQPGINVSANSATGFSATFSAPAAAAFTLFFMVSRVR